MEKRVYNFSAGPAVLPVSALQQAQRDLLALPGVGSSVLEISHRSKPFAEIAEKTEANLRKLLAIPENYRVLFLQGGAQLQFAMVPMNIMAGSGKSAAAELDPDADIIEIGGTLFKKKSVNENTIFVALTKSCQNALDENKKVNSKKVLFLNRAYDDAVYAASFIVADLFVIVLIKSGLTKYLN